jgi:hypothetical protein
MLFAELYNLIDLYIFFNYEECTQKVSEHGQSVECQTHEYV